MALVTGDRYLDSLVKFVEKQAGPLLEGTIVLKLNPLGLHYVHSRLEALKELEGLLAGAPVDYLRAYISDLGDHRALEQLRRILRLLTSLKIFSVLEAPIRDPTPISLVPFSRLRFLELRGCDLSSSAARGILELRHTLEKIICHNSTDALCHVFASRMVDVKSSHTWNRLSFISCACNGLVFMDESLQLLPAVETLDLSRNRISKVDNLQKCAKLKHLDLGFNHLQSVTSLSEMTCSITKLVLRNNALTTLHGVENLKSMEEIDLSHNIISNLFEIEVLSCLPHLKNLWLEGNPFCCARWYRPQVFSLFAHPVKLKLDDQEITKRESWKRRIIIASRQQRPIGNGFYYPVKEESEKEDFQMRKRKTSRLACIEDEKLKNHFGFEFADQESVSCNTENLHKDDNDLSGCENEIVNTMDRIELMKIERSIPWSQESSEWNDQTCEDTGSSKLPDLNFDKCYKGYREDLIDESAGIVLESATSSGDALTANPRCVFFESAKMNDVHEVSPNPNSKRMEPHKWLNLLSLSRTKPGDAKLLIIDNNKSHVMDGESSLTDIDEILVTRSLSVQLGSPPSFKEDLLHQRQNLEDKFMQLSTESYLIGSSDSDTSTSSDDDDRLDPFSYEEYQCVNKDDLLDDLRADLNIEKNNISSAQDSIVHLASIDISNISQTEQDRSICNDGSSNDGDINNNDINVTNEDMSLESRKSKRKAKKRIVSLSTEDFNAEDSSERTNGISGDKFDYLSEDGKRKPASSEKNIQCINDWASSLLKTEHNIMVEIDGYIEDYFHNKVADTGLSEVCGRCICCNCIFQQESEMREVVVLVSSQNKLYVLLIDVKSNGQGIVSKAMGCHNLEDVEEAFVGIGLYSLRVLIKGGVSYVFITQTFENAAELLYLLTCGSNVPASRCFPKSLEQDQVKLFEKYICGDMQTNLFMYSMFLLWQNDIQGGSWRLRSLFVIEGYIIVCIEDLLQFRLLSDSIRLSSSYYSLDSLCSIHDILEMAIDEKERCILSIMVDRSIPPSSFKPFFVSNLERTTPSNPDASFTWKLRWFSEQSLLKFVSLIKATRKGAKTPLVVKFFS